MRKTIGQFALRTSAFALTCLALGGTDAQAAEMTGTGTITTTAGNGTTTSVTGPATTVTGPATPSNPVPAVTSGTVATTVTSKAAMEAAPKTMEVAGATHTYSTAGTIMNDGITGTGVISFNPVATGSFAAPSSVGLGEFVVSTLPPGSETSYKNAHFQIAYNPVSVGNVALTAGATPVAITGVLNGKISGNQSSVQATFDPITSPVFSASDGKFLSTLNWLNNPLDLVPASAGGRTTIQAHVTTASPLPPSSGGGNSVPEPTTFALLATSLVGLGLRHRLRARKSA